MKDLILCVDDEKIVLNSLKAQLSRNFGNKYDYDFAESAFEALEIINSLGAQHNLLVIISDWLMPGMKGDELLKEVNHINPNIKKILLSGQAEPEIIDEIVQTINGLTIVSKPWLEDEVIKAIKLNLNL